MYIQVLQCDLTNIFYGRTLQNKSPQGNSNQTPLHTNRLYISTENFFFFLLNFNLIAHKAQINQLSYIL